MLCKKSKVENSEKHATIFTRKKGREEVRKEKKKERERKKGRKEGRKEERKKGRKEERHVHVHTHAHRYTHTVIGCTCKEYPSKGTQENSNTGVLWEEELGTGDSMEGKLTIYLFRNFVPSEYIAYSKHTIF